METWYLLYDGSSPDGRGMPDYIGRTLSREEAKAHHWKCWNDDYSIGRVKIITDTTEDIPFGDLYDWDEK